MQKREKRHIILKSSFALNGSFAWRETSMVENAFAELSKLDLKWKGTGLSAADRWICFLFGCVQPIALLAIATFSSALTGLKHFSLTTVITLIVDVGTLYCTFSLAAISLDPKHSTHPVVRWGVTGGVIFCSIAAVGITLVSYGLAILASLLVLSLAQLAVSMLVDFWIRLTPNEGRLCISQLLYVITIFAALFAGVGACVRFASSEKFFDFQEVRFLLILLSTSIPITAWYAFHETYWVIKIVRKGI